MSDTIAVAVHNGTIGGALLDELGGLYLEVYAEPPYGEGPDELPRFKDALLGQTRMRGFRLLTAREAGTLIGYTFGFVLPGHAGWWTDAVEPIPADVTAETGTRTFAVIELMVRASYRRRGIGRRLHRALTAGLPVERLTLLVRPEAGPAVAAYRAWGYQQVGSIRPAAGPVGSAAGPPTYMAMLRPVHSPGSGP